MLARGLEIAFPECGLCSSVMLLEQGRTGKEESAMWALVPRNGDQLPAFAALLEQLLFAVRALVRLLCVFFGRELADLAAVFALDMVDRLERDVWVVFQSSFPIVDCQCRIVIAKDFRNPFDARLRKLYIKQIRFRCPLHRLEQSRQRRGLVFQKILICLAVLVRIEHVRLRSRGQGGTELAEVVVAHGKSLCVRVKQSKQFRSCLGTVQRRVLRFPFEVGGERI